MTGSARSVAALCEQAEQLRVPQSITLSAWSEVVPLLTLTTLERCVWPAILAGCPIGLRPNTDLDEGGD